MSGQRGMLEDSPVMTPPVVKKLRFDSMTEYGDDILLDTIDGN